MQISFPPLNKINFDFAPKFKGQIKESKNDDFTPSVKTVKVRDKEVMGALQKPVYLKNKETGEIEKGFIIKDSNSRIEQYFACINNEGLCRMAIEDGKDHIYVDELYGQNNNGKYKGAGGELIKFAVEKSRQKGYGGKLEAQTVSSFPFYYKNNFRLTKDCHRNYNLMNAAIDYSVRTGGNVKDIWYFSNTTPISKLDEKGANALLEGKRLIDNSKSQILYSTKINLGGEETEADVDFCDFEDEFVIQIIDKKNSTPYLKNIASLEGSIENGKLIKNKITSNYFEEDQNVINELEKAYEKANRLYNLPK